jgi:transketolase
MAQTAVAQVALRTAAMDGPAQASTVEAYGRGLVRLGETRPEVVALGADTMKTMAVVPFAERFPQRTFNMGIAEQNMVMTAAGLATTGKIPFAATFSVFLSMRSLEQLRTFVCYPRLNVKLVGGLGGLTGSVHGPTHLAVEDVSVLRPIANLAVVVPADAVTAEAATLAAADWPGPLYLRVGTMCPVVYASPPPFQIGRAIPVKPGGRDVTIVAMGVMVSRALEAASRLAQDGIGARVLDMHTVKPLDEAILLDWVSDTGAVVTAEENSIVGGLGAAVAEVLAERHPAPLERVAIPQTFGDTSARYDEVLAHYGLTPDNIVVAARRVISRK